ncbi:MAG: hypothetical protein IRY99_07950 [Isosphaeraceae bacterium]|nr:hypothetical protein [Isosphaeraceae bacterium]
MDASSAFCFIDAASAQILRASGVLEDFGITLDLTALNPATFGIGGTFRMRCIGPDGEEKWDEPLKNGVTTAALGDVLNVYLRQQPQTPQWFMGIIDNAGFTGLAAGDSMASHPGWSEVTAYVGETRPSWSPNAATAGSVSNTTTVDFAINAAKVIKGLFIASASDKGGTAGLLFSTAAFSDGNKTVGAGDTLKVVYAVNAVAA